MSVSDLLLGRSRALLFRLHGGHAGSRARLDRGVRIDEPGAVRFGDSVHLEPDVWIKIVTPEARVQLGDFTFLGRGSEIDVSVSVTIGSHVLFGPGVFVTDHAHNIAAGRLIDSQGITSRAVVIEDDVWLGTRAVVLPGVTLGRGAVVGAGAVVTRDVPANAIVAGVPARLLRYRGDR